MSAAFTYPARLRAVADLIERLPDDLPAPHVTKHDVTWHLTHHGDDLAAAEIILDAVGGGEPDRRDLGGPGGFIALNAVSAEIGKFVLFLRAEKEPTPAPRRAPRRDLSALGVTR